MINIRKDAFETNSSSMHSLVVVKNPKPYSELELALDVYPNRKDFELFDSEGDAEFNRTPFKTLKSPKDKLKYYVAHELGNCEKFDKIVEIKKFIHNQTNIPIHDISLDAKERGYSLRSKRPYYGYVEHNDTGESPFDYLKRKNIDMKEFILNPKYVVIVDGDEYLYFKQMFECGMINADDFEDISSGANFWNDAEADIYLDWFDFDTDEEILEDRITDYTKVLTINIDKDTRRLYNKYIDRIKNIINEAKKINPNIKTRLAPCCGSEKGDISVKGLDVSIFDEIDL